VLTLAELIVQVKRRGLQQKQWRIRLIMPWANDFCDVYLTPTKWVMVIGDDALRQVMQAGSEVGVADLSFLKYRCYTDNEGGTRITQTLQGGRTIPFAVDVDSFEPCITPSFFVLDPVNGWLIEVELRQIDRAEVHVSVPEVIIANLLAAWGKISERSTT